MGRILAIRFSSLGDITLTFPALEYLAAQGHEIHILTKESFRPLVEARGLAARVHCISDHAPFSELRSRVASLKAENFDIVLDLHRNLRSRIACFFLGRPTWRVRKFRWRELFLCLFHRGLFKALGLAAVDRAQESLRIAAVAADRIRGVSSSSSSPPIVAWSRGFAKAPSTPQVVEAWAKGFPAGMACVALESAWRQKEWPAARFIEVARALREQGVGVVWVGLRKLPEAARLLEGSLDLTGRLTVPEVVSILARARLLVCNDAGLMHLAEASGTPVVAVFGPTSRELGFAPRLPGSRVVESELWCRPCSKTGRWCIRPVERYKCLVDISVADVAEAAKKSLQETLGR